MSATDAPGRKCKRLATIVLVCAPALRFSDGQLLRAHHALEAPTLAPGEAGQLLRSPAGFV
ncbi:MAG TPA: hypothetical protein VMI10_24165 [Terriglobales bacterium]|nr:hypothetical protein [Terriglobales bacterium]